MARGLITCVLKTGGDFTVDHVHWLKAQCARVMPDWEFACWSDIENWEFLPLTENLPKWWSKMEVYRDTYDATWPILMVDLDTVFLKPLEIRPEHEDKAIVIRDPWKDGHRHPERLAGGFMYLPTWARQRIWYAW